MLNSNKPQFIKYISSLGLQLLLALVALHPAIAQQKKPLKPEQYNTWHTLYPEAVSDNGQWVSYRIVYEDRDTLFVCNTASGETFRFKGATTGFFEGVSFITIDHGSLTCKNLKTKKEFTVSHVLGGMTGGNKLITLTVPAQDTVLTIYSLKGQELFTQKQVNAFELAPDKNKIAFWRTLNSSKELVVQDLGTLHSKGTVTKEGTIKKMWWSSDSNALFYRIEIKEKQAIGYYHLVSGLNSCLLLKDDSVFDGMELETTPKLSASQDGKRLFFKMHTPSTTEENKNPIVEVWNSKDKSLYPARQLIKGWQRISKLAYWDPESGQKGLLTDTVHPYGAVIAGGKYAIAYDPIQYEPTEKKPADRDIWLIDITTGQSKCIIRGMDGNQSSLLPSPAGNYIIYKKMERWYMYDIISGIHTIIDSGLPRQEDLEIAGWDLGDKAILLYDKYDLWKLDVRAKVAERLTYGREKDMIYRLVPQEQRQHQQYEGRVTISGAYNLSANLLLRGENLHADSSGYFILSPKGLSTICFGNWKVGNCIKAPGDITYIWTQEDYQTPPILMYGSTSVKCTELIRSNPQHYNYHWGNCTTIEYKTDSFGPQRGLLYYPAGYDPGKKYPMIVHIYEKQSGQFNKYIPPSTYNETGFNLTNYVTDGYFVLLPDIDYTPAKAGESAYECVTAAVYKVLAENIIDPERIGLVGHSFGGFEANYILTKTGIFRCAVSGAAITDFVSAYLSVDRNQDIPNYFKSEFGQARMGSGLFDNREAYLHNSPVLSAYSVTTPLLSWTGSKDLQVDMSQSMEFYLALRRLHKEHILLIYPGEGHGIYTIEKGIDLSMRVRQWFDHFLKGGPLQPWMSP